MLTTLSSYDIDPVTGFVPAQDPLQRLPPAFEKWERLVPEISALIRARRLRAALAALPLLDCAELTGRSERERALLLLTVFANGWVWAGEQPELEIPPQLAIPLCAVADALDRPPIVHYASMALNNWRRIDAARPLTSDNARMQVQFLGGVDEDWFFIGSLGVELAGAALLPLVHSAATASHADDDVGLTHALETIAAGTEAILQALARLREWCDPYIFYHRVRPFLAGWPEPGAIYRGVASTPRKYVGGSAGQSALIQALDALLGVDHGDSAAGAYLRDVRRYMPIGHRRFVEHLAAHSQVRLSAARASRALRTAYNSAVEQIALFRRRHIELARDYVTGPSGGDPGARGTGGTKFSEFLRRAEQDTLARRLPD